MPDWVRIPEIVFGSADPGISKRISQLVKEGKLKKIAPKVYTSQVDEEAEVLILRNLFFILGRLYPGAVLSFRSALEIRPSPKGLIYMTYSYTRKIKLPGIVLSFSEGPSALETDRVLNGELYLASLERALLENLLPSRVYQGGEAKTVAPEVIEERLAQVLQIEGEQKLNEIRDRAKDIANRFGWETAFEKLNEIISALLATKPSSLLRSPLALAISLGEPYDGSRIDLFWKLFAFLERYPLPYRRETILSTKANQNFSFFEAYFSNYIEGTEFEVEEAHEVVFHNLNLPNRSGDTHDIRGTYAIISNLAEMARTPNNPEEFLQLLQERHAILLAGRADKQPGQWKTHPNRAGNTTFVEPALVKGTLKKALDPLAALQHPLAKAILMMFVVSEVHPFEDGNGRIARIMMNAELVKGGLRRIIIPTVFREDYLLALRKLSRQHIPDAYVHMLNRAQAFSFWLNPENFTPLLDQLKSANAFDEPGKGKLVWKEEV